MVGSTELEAASQGDDNTFVSAVERIRQFVRSSAYLKGIELDRQLLIDRLTLERRVIHGWMSFMSSLVLFTIFCMVLVVEQVTASTSRIIPRGIRCQSQPLLCFCDGLPPYLRGMLSS